MKSLFSISLSQNRFVRYKVPILSFFILLALGPLGCSDDQAPPKSQEGGSPTAQKTPDNQEVVSDPTDENPEQVTGMESTLLRQKAQEQLNSAQETLEKARHLLQRAPSGKGSDLALSTLQQNLDTAETLFQTGQTQFNNQQYQMAQVQAREATEKADTVAQQIEQAIDTFKLNSP
jgi:hypothetical protein